MPRGAAVVEYHGKRGTVFRIKYADADGQQVMETVGAERDGWTRKKPEAELRERLVRVERKGYRRPGPLTFAEYAEIWFREGAVRRRWKPATIAQYRSVYRRLVDYFGAMSLAAIRPRHIAGYIAEVSGDLGPATVGRDVSVLSAIFTSAQREELVAANPAYRAERPKLPRRNWQILGPTEIPRVARAFTDAQARLVFITLVTTGVRRSELQALRWRDVDLVDLVLRVRDSKTEEGIRSIALSASLAEELWQHRRASMFQGDDERVFCHPTRGTIYRDDVFGDALRAALAVAGVEGHLRPFHDLRHASLTNGAAAGEPPIALMARAGHASMNTTKGYLHLAGVVFHEEAEALARRLGLGTPAGDEERSEGMTRPGTGVESSTHLR